MQCVTSLALLIMIQCTEGGCFERMRAAAAAQRALSSMALHHVAP